MDRSTPSEETVARLQRAGNAAVPVLIPGAFEKRTGQTVVPAVTVVAVPVLPQTRSGTPADRGRLEHEREGGGAPSQRKIVGRRP
jgi:hypothetical protein